MSFCQSLCECSFVLGFKNTIGRPPLRLGKSSNLKVHVLALRCENKTFLFAFHSEQCSWRVIYFSEKNGQPGSDLVAVYVYFIQDGKLPSVLNAPPKLLPLKTLLKTLNINEKTEIVTFDLYEKIIRKFWIFHDF